MMELKRGKIARTSSPSASYNRTMMELKQFKTIDSNIIKF